MPITPEDAKRLLLSAQQFPHGTKNEIYVSVVGTRQALLGREPNIIQDLNFYMRPDIADGVAVYVMDKDALERMAYKESFRNR